MKILVNKKQALTLMDSAEKLKKEAVAYQ